jgi:hypothetical protein
MREAVANVRAAPQAPAVRRAAISDAELDMRHNARLRTRPAVVTLHATCIDNALKVCDAVPGGPPWKRHQERRLQLALEWRARLSRNGVRAASPGTP